MFKWIQTDKLVRRLSDGASIPADPANADWQAFLKWCEGNTPEAADPTPAPADRSELANQDPAIRAAVLAVAQLAGKSEADAEAAFSTAMKGLK